MEINGGYTVEAKAAIDQMIADEGSNIQVTVSKSGKLNFGEKVEFEVFVVWNCKTLQNNKALLSTTLFDGMYYEVTYNGDKNEIYFDAYKKFENRCLSVE